MNEETKHGAAMDADTAEAAIKAELDWPDNDRWGHECDWREELECDLIDEVVAGGTTPEQAARKYTIATATSYIRESDHREEFDELAQSAQEKVAWMYGIQAISDAQLHSTMRRYAHWTDD